MYQFNILVNGNLVGYVSSQSDMEEYIDNSVTKELNRLKESALLHGHSTKFYVVKNDSGVSVYEQTPSFFTIDRRVYDIHWVKVLCLKLSNTQKFMDYFSQISSQIIINTCNWFGVPLIS